MCDLWDKFFYLLLEINNFINYVRKYYCLLLFLNFHTMNQRGLGMVYVEYLILQEVLGDLEDDVLICTSGNFLFCVVK